jgi:Ca2+-binding RTX toxin-like protein
VGEYAFPEGVKKFSIVDDGNGYRIIYGNDLDNVITGTENGEEELSGGWGNDKLIGYGRRDYLDGGAGNDTLTGGGGGDNVFGDYLSGGTGADNFVLQSGESGKTTITDFQAGEDKRQLTGLRYSSFADLNIASSENRLGGTDITID